MVGRSALLVSRRTPLRRSTCASYHSMADAYIRPHIESLHLAELAARHLDRLYVELLTGGGRRGGHLAQKTVAHTHAVLHKALADAVRSDLAPSNVASRAHVPTPNPDAPITPRRLDDWDADETRRFLATNAADLRPVARPMATADAGRRAQDQVARHQTRPCRPAANPRGTHQGRE